MHPFEPIKEDSFKFSSDSNFWGIISRFINQEVKVVSPGKNVTRIGLLSRMLIGRWKPVQYFLRSNKGSYSYSPFTIEEIKEISYDGVDFKIYLKDLPNE